MRGGLFAVLMLVVLSGCASPVEPVESDDTSSSESTTPSETQTSSASESGNVTSSTNATEGANRAPVIDSFLANITGLTVSYSFNASDADGDTLTYELSFGDGSANVTGTGPVGNGTYEFAAAGSYNLTLVVRDGAESANVTLKVDAVAAAGEIDRRTCSGRIGTGAVGLSINSGANSVGGCGFGTVSQDVIVAKLEATTGCKHDVSPTGSSSAYGTPNSEGAQWPSGAAFRIICDLGVVTFNGAIEFLPA